MKDSFSEPRVIVQQLALRDGARIADFGAGSGHYSRAAAGIVEPSGKVYAIDIQEDVLKHIKNNPQDHYQRLIETVWGDIERVGGTHLPDHAVDAVILANTFFQVDEREALRDEIKRVLKPGGKLLLVEWSGSYGGIGPSPERVVSESAAEAFFSAGGFTKTHAFRAGSHHYGMIYTAP